jgi:hypothetical protein
LVGLDDGGNTEDDGGNTEDDGGNTEDDGGNTGVHDGQPDEDIDMLFQLMKIIIFVNKKPEMASFTVFPYPLPTCENFDVDCSDPNSVLLHAILSISKESQENAAIGGANFAQIASFIPLLCPQLQWTDNDLQGYILNALRRGVLTTIFQLENDNSHPIIYAVNAGMWRMNPANKKYFCISQLYSSSSSSSI